MKQFVPMFLFALLLGGALHAQVPVRTAGAVPYVTTVPDQAPIRALPAPEANPPGVQAGSTVALKYHDITLPRYNWTMPTNISGSYNIMMFQRFTLPNSAAFLDSLNVYIESVSTGAVLFRVFPAQLINTGTADFWFPEFGPAIDSMWVDKTALKMQAFNTIKFSGKIVPKEFFVSAEITIAGGANNTVVLAGDGHDLPGVSQEKSRVCMLLTDGSALQFRLLDGTFVNSSTQQPIYSYLYMTAYADTGTSYVVPKILSTPTTKAYVGVQYKYDLHAGAVPRPAYKLISGPAAMTVDWYSGEVKWTPAAGDIGRKSVTVEAFNTNGTDQQTWNIDVIESTQPKITSFPKKVALVGEPYFYQTIATGGPEPTFMLTSALAGLTLDGVTGQLKVTPIAGQVGSHIVGITAKNAVGTDVQTFTIKIELTASAPKISTQAKATGTVNQPYTYQVASTGNPQPTFSLTKSPPGMTIDLNSGMIAWTPTQTGLYDVTVRSENRMGLDEQAYNLNIGTGASLPVFAFSPKTSTIAEQNFVDTARASANPAPTYHLLVSPTGMKIDSLKGVITWRPDRDQKGSNAVTVRATNTAGSVSFPYTIFVQTVPRITSTEVFTAKATELYQYQVTADAEPAASFSLSQAPTGMVINSVSGLITWTPTDAQKGQHPVTIVASNPAGSAQQAFSLTVTSTVGVASAPGAAEFALADVWPNPVTRGASATVTFTLARATHMSLDVRDVQGRLLASLVNGAREAGSHTAVIDVPTLASLPAGAYFVVLRVGTLQTAAPLTLLK
ncbi:MAG: putative Ig domain-containing protein [Ignavibacteria bacterium]|nr:putative Ig domain-containing protein [Ignavibacteria bacterium]